MARIIAIANQKGGVGKTTTAVNLAACLAVSAVKNRILLIDLDPQGNATMGCGIDKHNIRLSSYDVLLGEAAMGDALQFAEAARIQVLPANGDLTGAEVALLDADKGQLRLREAVQSVEGNFDYIIVDCPPSLNMLTVIALTAAHGVLIPIQCEYYALEGLSALLNTVEKIRSTINPQLRIDGLLRTMFDPRNRLANEVSEQLVTHFSSDVYSAVIPRNVRLAEAPSHGQPIIAYDSNSKGAESYALLAREVQQQKQRHSADSTAAA
jgi:chromosome partitioning protein